LKIRILSDIHLEFGPFEPPRTNADIVVLAGDIGLGTNGVEWANEAFQVPVVYVPGNHEFYLQEIGSALNAMRRAAAEHVHVLSNDLVEIGGVRFLGATLWTDFNLYGHARGIEARRLAWRVMPDFSCIRFNGRPFTPEASVALYAASCNWLEAVLREGDPARTVVVTHHAPCARSIAPRFQSGPMSVLNPAFASDLDRLMGHSALWVHGHTHDSFDYQVGATRVVCNPRGYVDEELNPGFDQNMGVDLG
jgi:predicted phosphodiesterase